MAPLAKLEGEEAAPVPEADVTTRVVKMLAEHRQTPVKTLVRVGRDARQNDACLVNCKATSASQ